MKTLKKMLLTLALFAPACLDSSHPTEESFEDTTASVAASSPVQIRVNSRRETTNQLTVDYTMNGTADRLVVTNSPSSMTHIVTRSGRLMLRAVLGRDGSGSLTNHAGQTFTLSQIRSNPALLAQFDREAVGTLDADVDAFLATGTTATVNPCTAHWALFIACGIGAYIAYCVDWAYHNGEWVVTGDCGPGKPPGSGA